MGNVVKLLYADGYIYDDNYWVPYIYLEWV